MKHNTIKKIKLIGLLSVLVAGTYVIAAGTWTEPTSSNDFRYVPIHGGASQVKDAGLIVGTFVGYGNADFKQDVYAKGMITGKPMTNSTDSVVTFGDGNIPAVNVLVRGTAEVVNILQADNLVTTGGDMPICSDTAGKIVLCNSPAPIDVCSNLAGIQVYLPQEYKYVAGGTCVWAAQSSSARLEVLNACDAPEPSGVGFLNGSPWQDNMERGGGITYKVTLNRAPNYDQDLKIRICTSFPETYGKYLGYGVTENAYHFCEGNPVTGGHETLPIRPTSPTYQPFLDTASPLPGKLTVHIPAGTTNVTIPGTFACGRAGKNNKEKWSYVYRVDYDFIRSNANDRIYTLIY
jgi:hypothetical protein